MFFVDTSYFVALMRTADDDHERAAQMYDELFSTGETALTSEAVISELVTLLARRDGIDLAASLTKGILDRGSIELVTGSLLDVYGALDAMQKYSLASYADGLSVTLMQNRGVMRIASFDSDFDRVKGIKRLC